MFDFTDSMLVTDETEGCMSKTLSSVELSLPHSASLIDLDGDCISDLFLTVKDTSSDKYFYEIYLRRDRSKADVYQENTSNQNGLNSYCLVARQEIDAGSVFKFADVDRDGMIDMVYTGSDLKLRILYNRLLNEMRHQQQN